MLQPETVKERIQATLFLQVTDASIICNGRTQTTPIFDPGRGLQIDCKSFEQMQP